MDFAKKILNKYGWKEGDGLGKNSSGISKPIKAKLKFDTTGFGADKANSDFNNHWWERVYNEAAHNVTVKEKNNRVQIALKNGDDAVEITTKGYSVKKLKKFKEKNIKNAKYEGFLQTSMLNGEKSENHYCIETGDIEVQKFKLLSDEELFKACGGRTAHKGARHGLKLSGKLARLENHEQEILAKMSQKDSVDKTLIQDEYAEFLDKGVEKNKSRKRKQKDSKINKEKANPSLATPEHVPQFNKNSNGGEKELSSKGNHKREVEYQKTLGGNELFEKADASTEKLGSENKVSPMENNHMSKSAKKKRKGKDKTS